MITQHRQRPRHPAGRAAAQEVEQEIASLREDAEARLRSLQAELAAISDERRTLLDDIRGIAARLEAIVAEAGPAEDETPSEEPGTPEPPTAETTDTMPPAGPNGADVQDQRPHATRSDRET